MQTQIVKNNQQANAQPHLPHPNHEINLHAQSIKMVAMNSSELA
jgi:hypothetical protein